MKRHATALRAFTHANENFVDRQVILNMEPGQFADWSAPGVDLVREATPAEVAAARGEKAAPAKKATARRRKAKPAATPAPIPTPAPAPAAPEA